MKRMIIGAMLATTIIGLSVAHSQQSVPSNHLFRFEVSIAEINLIDEGLGQLPYSKVAPLMGKLQAQFKMQQQPMPAPKQEEGQKK